MGALTSSEVMGTPSSSNSFWNVRTGAKTPASTTVPAQSNMQAWWESLNYSFLLSEVFLQNFTNNFKVGFDKWLNEGDTLTHYNPSYLHTSSVNRNISEFWHVGAVWSRKALFGITLMFAQLKKSCFIFVQNVLCLVVRQVGGLETSETSEVQSNARFGIT